MKNTFYFMFKNLFVPTIFKFLSRFFAHVGKWLDKKSRVIFKSYSTVDLDCDLEKLVGS